MTCKQPLTQVLKLTCIKIAVNYAINSNYSLGLKFGGKYALTS